MSKSLQASGLKLYEKRDFVTGVFSKFYKVFKNNYGGYFWKVAIYIPSVS